MMSEMTKLDTSKTEWDLSPLLAGDDDPKIEEYRKAVTKATDEFVAKWKDRDDYLKDPKVLREALDEVEAIENTPQIMGEAIYFHLRTSVDSSNTDLIAKNGQAEDFLKGIINKMQFFWLKVGKIDSKLQPEILKSSELQTYRHLLESTFDSAQYKLTEAEEKIILLKSSVANENWSNMRSKLLAASEREVIWEDGSKKMMSHSEILKEMSNVDKKVRDSAAQANNDILEHWIDVIEAEFNAILEDKKINDDIRGYTRPDQSRHVSDDISSEVVDALLEAISSTYDIPRRFYELRAKLFGVDKIEYHERNVPYGDAAIEHSYDRSVEIVIRVCERLDDDFARAFKGFVENGQIDVYPRKGKRSGAFCAYYGPAMPPFVLLNHTGKVDDTSTLAHEVGHAVNGELMRTTENALNYGTPMCTAEVASNFLEGFTLDHLLEEADDEQRLSLLIDSLDGNVAGIHRQAAFYLFEQEAHNTFRKEGYLSKIKIGEIFAKHMEAYMGPAVEQSPGSQNWWAYIPHFRYYFYVYSYVCGDLIAAAMRSKVKQDPGFMKHVKTFYSTGRSKSPQQIFADMGIDITDKAFWLEGLKEIERQLDETEKLAKKLGKI